MLKLEVGKSYIDRNGDKTLIIDNNGTDSYDFTGKDKNGSNFTFTENGHFYDIDIEDDFDLIEEVIKTLQLEVGKRYLNLKGEIVTIRNIRGTEEKHFDCDHGWAYKIDGTLWFCDLSDERTLIREVTEFTTGSVTNALTEEDDNPYAGRSADFVIFDEADTLTHPRTEAYMQLHSDLCDKMKAITKAKNSDYTGLGDDPFANFRIVEKVGICSVEQGFLTRMSDKMARINSFAQKGTLEVKDESVEDTLLDLANYCLLFYGYIQDKKENNDK